MEWWYLKIGSKIAEVETFLQLETTFFIIKKYHFSYIKHMFLNLYRFLYANGWPKSLHQIDLLLRITCSTTISLFYEDTQKNMEHISIQVVSNYGLTMPRCCCVIFHSYQLLIESDPRDGTLFSLENSFNSNDVNFDGIPCCAESVRSQRVIEAWLLTTKNISSWPSTFITYMSATPSVSRYQTAFFHFICGGFLHRPIWKWEKQYDNTRLRLNNLSMHLQY